MTTPSGVIFRTVASVDSGGSVYLTDMLNHSIRVGRPVLEDTAVIDVTTGAIGAPRQLSTSAQTATAWQWDVIRRPLDGAAELSSTTVRNPTFTPDVAGLFTLRLVATNGSAASISPVNFTSVIEGVARRRAVRR